MPDKIQFTPTKFDTVETKARVLKQLMKFVETGMPKNKFTKEMYRRLSTYLFGHIAHHNKEGFWDVWFEDAQRRYNWIEHVLGYHPVGDPAFTWCDVARQFKDWLSQNTDLIRKYQEDAEAEVKEHHMALAGALVKRYPEEVQKLLDKGEEDIDFASIPQL